MGKAIDLWRIKMGCRKYQSDCKECKGDACVYFDNDPKHANYICISCEECDSRRITWGGCHTCGNFHDKFEYAKELEANRIELEKRLAVLDKIRQGKYFSEDDAKIVDYLEGAFREEEPEIGYLFAWIDGYLTRGKEDNMDVDSSRVHILEHIMAVMWDYTRVFSEGRLYFGCEFHTCHPTKHYKYRYATIKFTTKPQ